MIVYPWKIAGEYEDGYKVEVSGNDEEECVGKLISIMDVHGKLEWYSGVSDEDYVDGEYIGRENFIYD